MRRWSAAIAAVCLLWGTWPVFAQDDTAAVPRISVAEARKLVDAGAAAVLDVRDPVSFAGGHLPGAVLFDSGNLAALVSSFRTSKKTVIVYCG